MNIDQEESLGSVPSSLRLAEQYDDSALEGVAANVKLLLKMIQDHKEACQTHKNDGRRMLRVAGMMTILDMVRTRIQKCQSFGTKQEVLRRCNTDLKLSQVPNQNEKILTELTVVDEKDNLIRELNASLASRKSLKVMCSSLGKEKEIMMGELACKAHELSEMEQHINDLKSQNETLLEKVKECANVHKPEHKETQGNVALQERHKMLSDQLLKSLNGYRTMKRRLKEAHEDNATMQATMEEMGVKVGASLEKIRSYRQNLKENSDEVADIEEGILEIEHISKCFDLSDRKHGTKRSDCCKHVLASKG